MNGLAAYEAHQARRGLGRRLDGCPAQAGRDATPAWARSLREPTTHMPDVALGNAHTRRLQRAETTMRLRRLAGGA